MTFRKWHPPAGSRPGALAIPPGSLPPELRTLRYGSDGIEERRVEEVEEPARVAARWPRAWIDVRGLGDERVPRRLAELFEIHPLALEAAVNVPQRAKSEAYEGQAVASLVCERSEFVSDEVRTYLRDTLDHAAQIIELVESSREMGVALLKIHMSNLGQRTNQVMRVLTVMASIFIPLSFVAGLYGMNFEYVPELHRRWGYPLVLAAMASVAAAMLWFFRRRGWIGAPGGGAGSGR